MLKTTTRLQRVPALQIQLSSGDNVCVIHNDVPHWFGAYTLAILDVFDKPKTMQEGIAILQKRTHTTTDWIALTAELMEMVRHGILVDPESGVIPLLSTRPFGYDASLLHTKMLNDRERTARYLEAIANVVKPGDVVVEIGTGTGVLATGAAKAGAKHVYAIEAEQIGEVAQKVFEANGIADRVTLVRGWSTTVELPERADVLISELIGNDPFTEETVKFTNDAIQRFLKPDARIIPQSVTLYGVPVQVPDELYLDTLFSKKAVERWKAWYDIDFSPLADVVETGGQLASLRYSNYPHQRLGEPIALMTMNLTDVHTSIALESRSVAQIAQDGLLNAVVMYFDLRISDGVQLTTSPYDAARADAWAIQIWILGSPFEAKVGDQFAIEYQYNRLENDLRLAVSPVQGSESQ